MLIVALAFLVTWVIPNQVVFFVLIQFPNANDGAALKLRSTLSLGAFAGKSLY